MTTNKPLSEIQKDYMNNDALKPERGAIHESWFDENTIDFWRHKRMYQTITPFVEKFKDATWVTIGDGRFGLDSIRLKKLFGIKSILATDISENMLEISKQKGLIDAYKVENAEHLSFADNSFDVVFCKETFHHFPKPFMGLYEMIRVCKEAVILIEPAEKIYTNDVKSKKYLKSAFKLFFSKLIFKQYLPYLPSKYSVSHGYEDAGNYIYTVSIRELERLIHGMDLGDLAFKKFSDFYIKGCEFEEGIPGNPMMKEMNELLEQDLKLTESLPEYYQPNMVTAILFKNKIDESLRSSMISAGFHFVDKLENPYS